MARPPAALLSVGQLVETSQPSGPITPFTVRAYQLARESYPSPFPNFLLNRYCVYFARTNSPRTRGVRKQRHQPQQKCRSPASGMSMSEETEREKCEYWDTSKFDGRIPGGGWMRLWRGNGGKPSCTNHTPMERSHHGSRWKGGGGVCSNGTQQVQSRDLLTDRWKEGGGGGSRLKGRMWGSACSKGVSRYHHRKRRTYRRRSGGCLRQYSMRN